MSNVQEETTITQTAPLSQVETRISLSHRCARRQSGGMSIVGVHCLSVLLHLPLRQRCCVVCLKHAQRHGGSNALLKSGLCHFGFVLCDGPAWHVGAALAMCSRDTLCQRACVGCNSCMLVLLKETAVSLSSFSRLRKVRSKASNLKFELLRHTYPALIDNCWLYTLKITRGTFWSLQQLKVNNFVVSIVCTMLNSLALLDFASLDLDFASLDLDLAL